MKHYIGALEVRNGEYEYTCYFRFRETCDEKADKVVDYLAASYYGHPDNYESEETDMEIDTVPEKEDGGWYFNGGEVHVKPYSHYQVSESAYSEMIMLTEV